MVFKATFNNISVLLVEETGVPGEKQPPVASHCHLPLKQISPTNRIGGVMVSMSASASSVVNLSFESSQRLLNWFLLLLR
jgi:hypothetical protein